MTAADWWVVVDRFDVDTLAELPALVLGPFTEAVAMEELESDGGTVYSLCTDDAKTGGYFVDDVRALQSAEPPAGERTPLYEWIYLGG